MTAPSAGKGIVYSTSSGSACGFEYSWTSVVEASPPSSFYRLKKLARKNKATFAAIAAVVTALVAATVVGVVLVAIGGGDGVVVTVASVAWGLVAGWSYSAWYLAGKPLLRRYSPVTISAWTLVSGAVVLLPFAAPRSPSAEVWLLLVGLAVVSTYLPALAYYSGLGSVDASRAAIVATIEPVVAVGIGVLVADERLSPLAALGGVIVLAAATFASARR